MPFSSALSARFSAIPVVPKITTPPKRFGVSSIASIARNPARLPNARQFGENVTWSIPRDRAQAAAIASTPFRSAL